MAGSLNKVMLIGNLGQDPEVRSFQNGGKVCNLRIATSEQWKDRNTGERHERTEWHTVAIFSEGLINVCENYLKKGSKVFIEGKLQTRKWQDQNGQDRYSTEVVLRGFDGTLTMLDGPGGGQRGGAGGGGGKYGGGQSGGGYRLEPLEDQRAVPDRAKPFQVPPRKAWVELGCHVLGQVHCRGPVTPGRTLGTGESDRLGAQETPGPAGMAQAVEQRARTDFRWEGEPASHVAFPTPQHRRVDGYAKRLEPGGRGPVHQPLDKRPVPPCVDLEPEPGVGPGDCRALLDGASAHGGKGEWDPGPTSRPHHGQLALRIGDAGEAGRSKH